jgi:predicted transcriptional regulator of viral defense system
MRGTSYPTVYELAEDQHGYFTTAQAKEAGITRPTLSKMVRRGELERVSWGVYRLVHFPPSSNDHYMAATLWPLSARGVISHESALALYGLSDVNPSKVHLTLPRSFRLQREVPKGIVVHRADLRDAEIGSQDGISITTPERTIRDCHAAHLGPALIRQAIEDGARTGYLRRKEAEALERDLLGTRPQVEER